MSNNDILKKNFMNKDCLFCFFIMMSFFAFIIFVVSTISIINKSNYAADLIGQMCSGIFLMAGVISLIKLNIKRDSISNKTTHNKSVNKKGKVWSEKSKRWVKYTRQTYNSGRGENK